MARKPNSEFIQIIEGELFEGKTSLGVVQCRDFSQEPDLHIRKMDKTEEVVHGIMSFEFEYREEIDTDKKFTLHFADEEAPMAVALESNGAGQKLEYSYRAHTLEVTEKVK